MKKILVLLAISSFLLAGCSYGKEDEENDTSVNYNIEILEKIEIESFSAKQTVYINESNLDDLCGLWEKNPDLIQNFLRADGILVAQPDGEMLQLIEGQLHIPIQRGETSDKKQELRFVIFCEKDGIIGARKVLVENGVNYKDEEIIRIAISKLKEEANWEKLMASGPDYVGSEGYVYVGKNALVLNVRQDLYTIQDSLGLDTYFAITNLSADALDSSLEMKCSLETTTSSMSYVVSEPCGITPKDAEEVKLMTGFETITWKQNIEGVNMEANHMPQGELWNVVSKNEKTNLKMGIIWDCPMEKEKVAFLSTIQIAMDDEECVIQDAFLYEVHE